MYDAGESLQKKERLERRTRRWSRRLAYGVVAMACLVLLGWVIDNRFLTHLWSQEASMKPLTAIGFLLAGTSLVLLADERENARRRRAGKAAAWMLVGLGVLCLTIRATSWAKGVNFSAEHPGWPEYLLMPAWATATALVLVGVTLLSLRSTRRWAVILDRTATMAVGLIASIAMMAYAMGVADLYGEEPYRTMAMHTAAGLFVMSIGMCLARPDRGFVSLLLRDDAGGAVARQLLPAVVAAPMVVGVAVETIEEAGVWGPRMAVGIVVVLVVVGGVFAVGTTAMNLSLADRQRREIERRNRAMLAELDHRVKNTMAAVLSLCEQTAAGCGSIDEFKRSYRGRLQAMARAHEALAATKWQGVSLRGIASTILGAYAFLNGRTLEIEGEDLVLPGSAALPIAVTINELATNAVKHGAWSNPKTMGVVRVAWRVNGDSLEIDWSESGGPTPVVFPNGGFGLSLIRGMIPHEMGGTVELTAEPEGMACRIRLSLGEARKTTALKFAMAS